MTFAAELYYKNSHINLACKVRLRLFMPAELTLSRTLMRVRPSGSVSNLSKKRGRVYFNGISYFKYRTWYEIQTEADIL